MLNPGHLEIREAYVRIFIEFVRSDVINGEDELDIPLLGFFNQSCHLLGTSCVEQRISNLSKRCVKDIYFEVLTVNTETLSSVFLNVKAIPPQIMRELTLISQSAKESEPNYSFYLVQHVIYQLDFIRNLRTT